MSSVPLSILDRANTRVQHDQTVGAPQIFAEVTSRARHAEQLGYHRFWVAQHHSVPGIAGSAPTVLLAHLAEATSHIRVGTGGIMVPSHQPFIIAEQLGTLQALYPNRVDAGLGASVGFTKPARAALRQQADAKEHFADDVDELLGYLDTTGAITAYPQDRSQTPIYLLTGGGSAQFAASRGIGLVLGGPAVSRGLRASGEINQTVVDYREAFVQATPRGQQPHVIASINVAVADSREAARQLVLSEVWALTRSRSIGVFEPLEDPAAISAEHDSAQQRQRVERALASTIYGTPEDVVAQLALVLRYTLADEIMVTGNIWDPEAQQTSDRLLIEAWQQR
ncbi:MsnO8 family LLM class oxidoreductase [Yaniella halotolerans]|uniref:MsnO8 family LLM class oxidoreductase n=1 Tax=Yaniella halotolerans TaxID=225453 RepID=UPI0003B4F713|nr:MsnO8 family LLM class oxidoreductase [Yaniella halotolerans]